MKACIRGGIAILALSAAAFWVLSRPGESVAGEEFAKLRPDVGNGEVMFNIGGCASCHARPVSDDEQKGDVFDLSGGKRFDTDFGTFVAPNITTHAENGIGAWTLSDFATAMLKGVSPDGRHYYPAFPYTSYARMSLQDVVDLKAFLDTLPADPTPSGVHELHFPFSFRRGLGLWKLLYLDDAPIVVLHDATPRQSRGRYLVEGPGHCGECHTPRGALGGLDKTRWLAGAPSLEGDGSTPNITPGPTGIGDWGTSDVAEYLSSGFTPEYDVVGGAMAEVVDNTARIPAEDRESIAAYLGVIPPVVDTEQE